MIRRFIIELEDTLKGYNEDVEMLERKYGAEEQPQGEWIGEHFVYKCSKCGHIADSVLSITGRNIIPMLSNFCPEYGADMREADNETDN